MISCILRNLLMFSWFWEIAADSERSAWAAALMCGSEAGRTIFFDEYAGRLRACRKAAKKYVEPEESDQAKRCQSSSMSVYAIQKGTWKSYVIINGAWGVAIFKRSQGIQSFIIPRFMISLQAWPMLKVKRSIRGDVFQDSQELLETMSCWKPGATGHKLDSLVATFRGWYRTWGIRNASKSCVSEYQVPKSEVGFYFDYNLMNAEAIGDLRVWPVLSVCEV